jgi:hypothetical protein
MKEQSFIYEADGKDFSCSYEISGRGKHLMVEVITPWGTKSTQKGGSPALTIARMMAGELYRDYKSMNSPRSVSISWCPRLGMMHHGVMDMAF